MKKTIASVAEARLIIWRRLATTAREDGRHVEWDDDVEGGYDEPAVRRLVKASKDVAESIERRIAKAKRGRAVFASEVQTRPSQPSSNEQEKKTK